MPIPVHFSSLIPKMSIFTLSISCLTTFSLPWFMDLTFQVPKQYCSLQHQTLLLSPVTSTTGIVFALAPSLHSLWNYFSTVVQEHIGYLPTWGVHFQCPIFLPFHTVHGVLKGIILKWFAIRFSSGSCIVRPWPVRLEWLYTAWLIVSELDKAVLPWVHGTFWRRLPLSSLLPL